MYRSLIASAAFAVVVFAAACNTATLTTPGSSGDPGTSSGEPMGTPDEDGGMTSGGPGTEGGSGPVGPDTVSVIVEPTDKAQALLTAIQGATKSVHMTMYLLNDKRFLDALIARKAAGLDVKVILNKTFPMGAGTNTSAFNTLQAGGVSVVWAPSTFTLTHEKCVIIDGAQAWIMTMNLEVSSPTNREFLAVDTQAADVAEADAIFAADFANTAITPMGNLLVAPVNARDRLVALIQGAKTSVDLEGEELSDYKIVDALVAAKKANIAVRVVLASDTSPPAAQTTAIQQLKAAGIKVVALSNPYVHAKALIVDGARAYVGSENFTTGSLQYNRELGLITTNAASAASIAATIGQDFTSGSPL
jgi:phosphatidylserine/phosphatidylglycerophosphate/cardiolipin synthase-like enzyme